MRRALGFCVPAAAIALWLTAGPVARPAARPPQPKAQSLIVQAADLERAREIVRAVGGTVTHELGIIGAVVAELSPAQVQALRDIRPTPRIYGNTTVQAAYDSDWWSQDVTDGSSTRPATYYPTLIGANRLHAQGITGSGVTVAVLDSGLWEYSTLRNDSAGRPRIRARYDAIANRLSFWNGVSDGFGHGTHVTSIILDSGRTADGDFEGVAPDARVIPVKAFDGRGMGTYANVIRGIGWVVANKDFYGIRVLNCSFSAKPRSHYWDDPLNQAIMRAWQAGIVVVVSAGNAGPDAMTIGVPGNVPYVVTVGAMTDNNTPSLFTDDKLASFTSAGPTVEGFVKPDLVAPGGHMIGVMSGDSYLAQAYPSYRVGSSYFRMSGTSQAAAVVSGAAALLLDANPELGPDDVKCQLLAGARPAVTGAGALAYSVFQQGAGVVSAYDSVRDGRMGCANDGLDVWKDLRGVQHYGGRANRTSGGTYYLMGLRG